MSETRNIDDALPSNVWPESGGRVGPYHRYPAYTWPWFRRRAIVLWPLAIAQGVFMGVWHAASMSVWADAFPLGSRAILASLLTVSVGPLLAMFVRYRRLPYVAESTLVVVAIVVGVVISHVLQQLVAEYHWMLMEGLHDKTMHTPKAVKTVSQAVGLLMGQLPYWIVLFLFGGGWELKSYLGERRLLAEHARRA